MSPQKQAAQVANSQHSSGPRTADGKLRSSQNALRHSLCAKKYLIVPEERAEFDQHRAELFAALAPQGAIESNLAEAIVIDYWRLARARALENQIFVRGQMSSEDRLFAGAETWLAHAKELATLTLYEQRINRALARNKAELEALQSSRAALPAPAQSAEPNPEPETANPVADNHNPAIPGPAAPVTSSGFVHSSAALAHHESPEIAPEAVPIDPPPARRAA